MTDEETDKVETVVSPQEKALAKYFDLQLTRVAAEAYHDKDYFKAAMMSWSYIEQYYLPTTIQSVAEKHKLSAPKNLHRASAAVLINYYLLVTHDKEIHEKLLKAKSLRNDITHKMFKTKSITEIEELSKKSAKYNLDLIIKDMFDREDGTTPMPSLMIWINARNELRKEQRERLENIIGNTSEKKTKDKD